MDKPTSCTMRLVKNDRMNAIVQNLEKIAESKNVSLELGEVQIE